MNSAARFPGSGVRLRGCLPLLAVAVLGWVSTLEAHAQLRITVQPSSQMVALSNRVTFRVAAIGTPPLTYQWFFNQEALPGATNSSLLMTNLQRAAAGRYFATVADASGAVTSRLARLDVYVRSGIFDIGDLVDFPRILSTNAVLTRLATNNVWIEGPVWVPADGGYLVYSAMGQNRLKKVVPPSTHTDFLVPPANTLFNGNALDMHERLISCQAGRAGLRVVLTTNGVSVPLVNQYTNGAKFYSPNDLAMKSDGSIWFTDPGYDSGLPLPSGSSFPAGYQPGLYVYRFFQTNGNATVLQVVTNVARPNGICLSPDETRLYVADSANAPGNIWAYDITAENTVTGGAVFCTLGDGVPDGIKCDVDGRVWSSANDGVEIFAPDGHLVGRIRLTRTANLCFGGPDYRTLFMVGQPYVTSIPVLVPGAAALRRLRAIRVGDRVSLTWPAPSTGFVPESAAAITAPTTWTEVGETPTVAEEWTRLDVPAAGPARFFRLRLR